MRRRAPWMLAMLLLGAWPLVMAARPWPNPERTSRGFRLMARSVAALNANQVFCSLNAVGEICRDSTGSGSAGGGFWPKGTRDQYLFTSGLQAAGIIGGLRSEFRWAGD